MAEWPFWAAVRTVKEGLSGRAGLGAYRRGGGSIADGTWFRMIGEARAALANRGDEISRPLNRRPTADETTVWTTRKASGWAQQVEVMFRDRDTNAIIARPYFLTGRQLRSRQFVIDEAMGIYNPEGTDGDRQQLLGAIYTGTYRMIPE